jgi:hypothetical protein
VASRLSKFNTAASHSLARFCLILLFLALCVERVSAAKHPVPLDPKADPATCLQCHEDKTKGKSVHSAMAMGCQADYGDSLQAVPHLPRR